MRRWLWVGPGFARPPLERSVEFVLSRSLWAQGFRSHGILGRVSHVPRTSFVAVTPRVDMIPKKFIAPGFRRFAFLAHFLLKHHK